MAVKVELRIPLQQYGFVTVSGDTVLEVRDAAEAVYTEKLWEVGIEVEATAVAFSRLGSGTRVVETRTEPPPPIVVGVPEPVAVAAPPVQAAPVQAAPPAPAGMACVHGGRIHRTGQSAKGPWSAWFCPQPKGSSDACSPVWK